MGYRIAIAASIGILGASAAFALPAFTDWRAPTNAEQVPGASPVLNSPAVDGCVSLSRDGLEMYFNSNRAGSQDIYVARRASRSDGFGTPEPLPSTINTAATEFCPTSVQGNRLYFSRSRTGDPGDLMVSRYGPSGWGTPVALGPEINSPLMEEAADLFEDDTGRDVLIFSRRPATGPGGQIFQSIEGGAATLVAGGPNAGGGNNRATITHDGLTILFDSTRPGGTGGVDLWMATRGATGQAFGPATPLTGLNSAGFDARPSLSWDASELYFSSDRAGSESVAPDIWRTVRERAGGPKTITF